MKKIVLIKIIEKNLTSIFYIITTTPYLILSSILIFTNRRFYNDYKNVLREIDKINSNLDISYLNSLIMAEDHRYKIHKGIDFISILRAIKSTFIHKKFQGASTIEQQLVRVVTFRYERTIKRKIREQLLSVLVSKSRTKLCIATTYLSIGYFGYNLKGYKSLINSKPLSENIDFQDIIASHLKYPQPKNKSYNWEEKIIDRVAYIKERKITHSIYLFHK